MEEYILREDVLRCVEEDGRKNELDLGYPDHNEAFKEIVKAIPAADVVEVRQNAPAVDAVPVCRCENCVYWDAGTRQHHKDGESEWDEAICDYFHEIGISQTVYTNANWFCADGERKGGDE